MPDSSWEHAAEARAALNAIVTDPEHGVSALSSPRTMSNLLKDLLPDAPREKNLLVAAAEAGLADTLREHVDQGMDSGTAIRLAASSFSHRSPLSQDACDWVTTEIAMAMGMTVSAGNAGSAGPGAPAGNGSAPTPASGGGGWYGAGGAPSGGWYDRAGTGSGPGNPGGTSGPGGAGTGYPGGPTSPGGVGYVPEPPPGYAGQAGYSPGAGQPFAPLTGQPYPPAPMPGYQPVPGHSRSSNTMAVVSFVLGLVQFIGWFIFLLPGFAAAIAAIVVGFISLKQVNRTGERGRGLAITGIVLGFVGIAIVGLLIIIGVAAIHDDS